MFEISTISSSMSIASSSNEILREIIEIVDFLGGLIGRRIFGGSFSDFVFKFNVVRKPECRLFCYVIYDMLQLVDRMTRLLIMKSKGYLYVVYQRVVTKGQ